MSVRQLIKEVPALESGSVGHLVDAFAVTAVSEGTTQTRAFVRPVGGGFEWPTHLSDIRPVESAPGEERSGG